MMERVMGSKWTWATVAGGWSLAMFMEREAARQGGSSLRFYIEIAGILLLFVAAVIVIFTRGKRQ